ncbi:unnamed protein product [Hydatigera taeniaeformis]|uniref:C2H2-type domain-containing protein n=1 Tax=Hydatigena taeniaeformis TaxID=6205 RepID=A0A0R3X054_HYDTA|nr:unnamed protein product [Hydatigera taeniaeformis]
MTAREPFKPISIDKKLGEVYFYEKCLLTGFGMAPKMDPFTDEHAGAMLKKTKNGKKPIKIKVMALADSLKLSKASHIGKKPPHSRIKYSEVKMHKIFAHSKKVLVLGVQVSGNPQQYLILTFEQPLKASRLDDELTYADDAPKHNLKNRISAFDRLGVGQPSPTAVIDNSPSLIKATRDASHESLKSLSEQPGGSRETTPILENNFPLAKLYPSAEELDDVSTSRVVGLPRQPAHSPSLSPSPPTSPMTTQSNAHISQSLSYNPSQTETLNEPINSKELNAPICAKCRSECKDLVSTATSPVKMPATESRSGSSSSSHSHAHSDSGPQSYSATRSPDKSTHNGRSDSRTSTASHRTMTTDASSHYVIYGERPLYEQQIRSNQQQKRRSSLVNKITFPSQDKSPTRTAKPRPRATSTSSSSSSSSSTSSSPPSSERQITPKREHRPKSLDSSCRLCNHEFSDAPKAAPDSSKPLFILATGRFKPFSELSHEHNIQTQGVCSICGEVGVGDPRQVEIIRTDSSRGPVISDDGTVYMYSTTRPAECANGDGSRRKNRHHHSSARHRHSSDSRSSSSSDGSYRNGIEQPAMTAVPLRRYSTSKSASLTEVHVPTESRQHSHHDSFKQKKIYRLDSSDSDSSSSSSDEDEKSHLGNIKVVPLRY